MNRERVRRALTIPRFHVGVMIGGVIQPEPCVHRQRRRILPGVNRYRRKNRLFITHRRERVRGLERRRRPIGVAAVRRVTVVCIFPGGRWSL